MWLVFNVALSLATLLPHWPTTAFSWVNRSLYFLAFLLSVYILQRDCYNRDIFLNLAILFFTCVAVGISIFVGKHFTFGDDYLAYTLFTWHKILPSSLLAFSVIFITVKYLFREKGALFCYLTTLLIVAPFFVFHFYPYLLDRYYVLRTGVPSLYQHVFHMALLPLFFTGAYGIFLYRHDRPTSEYLNLIMVWFFVVVSQELVDAFCSYKGITLFTARQYILVLNLVFLIAVLWKKFVYTYSPFGTFYEDLVFSRSGLKLSLRRRKETNAKILAFLKSYFGLRKNVFASLAFLLVFLMSYFRVPLFWQLNLVVTVACLMVVTVFFASLYEKRWKRGNLLPH